MQEHGFAGWIWTACVFVGLQDGLCLFACVLGCLSVCVCVCACVCSSKSDKGCFLDTSLVLRISFSVASVDLCPSVYVCGRASVSICL